MSGDIENKDQGNESPEAKLRKGLYGGLDHIDSLTEGKNTRAARAVEAASPVVRESIDELAAVHHSEGVAGYWPFMMYQLMLQVVKDAPNRQEAKDLADEIWEEYYTVAAEIGLLQRNTIEAAVKEKPE